MNGAREYDSVRTTTAAESISGGRVVPAGAEGAVLDARLDGSCLAEVALVPQTADDDGDFGQVVLADGQYEVIRVHDQDQGGTRPGSAFEDRSVVFVIGAGENRDGDAVTNMYARPRERPAATRAARQAAGDSVRHFYWERHGHVRVSARLAGS